MSGVSLLPGLVNPPPRRPILLFLDLGRKSTIVEQMRVPNPKQSRLGGSWFFTFDSPGGPGSAVPWGCPSNQETFRGLSARPTSFLTASSCQTEYAVSVPSNPGLRGSF